VSDLDRAVVARRQYPSSAFLGGRQVSSRLYSLPAALSRPRVTTWRSGPDPARAELGQVELGLVDFPTDGGVVLVDPGTRVVGHRLDADEPIDELGRAT